MSDFAEIIVPPEDYNHEFVPGRVKAAIRDSGATSNDLLMVPIDNLVVDENFNVRIWDAQREADVERYKDSIIANGFYRHMPLSGYAGKRDGRDVIYVTGGFTRLESAKRARDAGAPIDKLPVVLKPNGTNMIDLTVALAVDNTGTPLRPYEKAIVAKRLIGFGLTERQVATHLGLSVPYINNLLYLISLPAGLRQLVVEGRINAGYCVERAKALGPDEALQMFQDELELTDELPAGSETTYGQDLDSEDGGVADRERPEIKRPKAPRKPGNITAKQALAAIDHALELIDDDASAGIDWLIGWRTGDKKVVEELKTLMTAARKKTLSKKQQRPEEPLTAPTDDEVRRAAVAEISRSAGPAQAVESDDDEELEGDIDESEEDDEEEDL